MMVNCKEYNLDQMKRLAKFAKIRKSYVTQNYPDYATCLYYAEKSVTGREHGTSSTTGVLTALSRTERLSSPGRRQREGLG